MRSVKVGIVVKATDHWINAELPEAESSALAGTQCSCGGQSGSGTCGSLARKPELQSEQDE